MTDLFEKLNTLVRAGLRDLIGADKFDLDTLRRVLTPEKLGKELPAEVAALRQKINQALDYEDELSRRVQGFQQEVEQLDAKADDAVAQGLQDEARALVAQMQRAQQRLAMAESDLRAHRTVTQELIQRVNMLEAVVADAQAAAQQESAQPAAPPAEKPSVADVIRTAREQSSSSNSSSSDTLPTPPSDRKAIDDDLERRRQRLSKP